MYVSTAIPDLRGTFYCSTCHVELEGENKLVGLNEGSAYDIYRCPRCFLVHWAPRPLNKTKLAS
jgi:DNA-directed RNA polymerase subunit RPC12/RpoP